MDNRTNFGHISGQIVSINKVPLLDDVLTGNYLLGIMKVLRGTEKCDYVPIVFTQSEIKAHPTLIDNGKFLVSGSFRTFLINLNNKNLKIQLFYASQITEQVNDRRALINQIKNNRINLTGEIKSMDRIKTFNSKDMLRFLLQVDECQPNHSSLISCVAWGVTSKFINMLGEGEKITIQGCIQSHFAYNQNKRKVPVIKNNVSVLKIVSMDDNEIPLDFRY